MLASQLSKKHATKKPIPVTKETFYASSRFSPTTFSLVLDKFF